MNISADQTFHEMMMNSEAGQKPEWTNMKEYWNKRRQVQKKLQATHPLYRYPKSPYSNLTKFVLNAKSTTRLEQLCKPKKIFATLNDSLLNLNINEFHVEKEQKGAQRKSM
jgi:hypothetical protein